MLETEDQGQELLICMQEVIKFKHKQYESHYIFNHFLLPKGTGSLVIKAATLK